MEECVESAPKCLMTGRLGLLGSSAVTIQLCLGATGVGGLMMLLSFGRRSMPGRSDGGRLCFSSDSQFGQNNAGEQCMLYRLRKTSSPPFCFCIWSISHDGPDRSCNLLRNRLRQLLRSLSSDPLHGALQSL